MFYKVSVQDNGIEADSPEEAVSLFRQFVSENTLGGYILVTDESGNTTKF